LPIPGSPPMRVNAPGTMPPPRTRSNSPRDVEIRGASSVATSTSAIGSVSPDRTSPATGGARRAPSVGVAKGAAAFTDSTSVFHAPQSGQRPCHLGASWAHSWQVKTERGRATSCSGGPLSAKQGRDPRRVPSKAASGGLARKRPQPSRARASLPPGRSLAW
jgi:hypothetical protein